MQLYKLFLPVEQLQQLMAIPWSEKVDGRFFKFIIT
jgi:hypothetical protein